MSELGEVWRRLSKADKRKSVFAGFLCLWGVVLTADMHFLRKRKDFQEKFNLPDEEAQATQEEEEQKPWRLNKDQAQVDAEVAQRAAQLAAAATTGQNLQQQHASAESSSQPESKSWFSVKFKW